MSWLDADIPDELEYHPRPVREYKPKATFALPLEDKQLVIDALYTWKSAYRSKQRYPQVQRDWTRIDRILKELEGE